MSIEMKFIKELLAVCDRWYTPEQFSLEAYQAKPGAHRDYRILITIKQDVSKLEEAK